MRDDTSNVQSPQNVALREATLSGVIDHEWHAEVRHARVKDIRLAGVPGVQGMGEFVALRLDNGDVLYTPSAWISDLLPLHGTHVTYRMRWPSQAYLDATLGAQWDVVYDQLTVGERRVHGVEE